MRDTNKKPPAPTNGMGDSSLFKKGKRACPFEAAKFVDIDYYRDLPTISSFKTEGGKILPRRMTGISHFYQRRLQRAIKRARFMALLPFVAND